MDSKVVKWIVGIVGALLATAIIGAVAAVALADAPAPPKPPVSASQATVNNSVSQVLVIVERPVNWSGEPLVVHYYVFIGKNGEVATASPDDVTENRVIYDTLTYLKLLGHYQVIPITPKTRLPRACA